MRRGSERAGLQNVVVLLAAWELEATGRWGKLAELDEALVTIGSSQRVGFA